MVLLPYPETAASLAPVSSAELALGASAPGELPASSSPGVARAEVKLLSSDGTWDAQQLSVSHGALLLSEPGEEEPTLAERLLGADERTAFDLLLLESAVCGEGLLRSPAAALLPGLATYGAEVLNRMLLLSFQGDEVLCLWLMSAEDCQRCLHAVRVEAGVLQG